MVGTLSGRIWVLSSKDLQESLEAEMTGVNVELSVA